jgi:hypothetical protein
MLSFTMYIFLSSYIFSHQFHYLIKSNFQSKLKLISVQRMTRLLAALMRSTLITWIYRIVPASVFLIQSVGWNNICSYFTEDVVAATNHQLIFLSNYLYYVMMIRVLVCITVCHYPFSMMLQPIHCNGILRTFTSIPETLMSLKTLWNATSVRYTQSD